MGDAGGDMTKLIVSFYAANVKQFLFHQNNFTVNTNNGFTPTDIYKVNVSKCFN